MNRGLVVAVILFMIALVSFLISANHRDTQNYRLDSYIDTIDSNIILTIVADNGDNISISTIKLN